MANAKLRQTLVPARVFIGDGAELRCVFSSDDFSDFSIKNFANGGAIELPLENFTAPLDFREYEILKVRIFQSGENVFQLTIDFKAWKTGQIQFPPLKIDEELFEFSPINIASLAEQNKISQIQENSGPLLLPYTTYKIFGVAIAFFLAIIAIFRLIKKREKIIFFIKKQSLKRKYKKNKKQTLKRLQKIAKTETSDADFSENFQRVMRNYLRQRFDAPFLNCVTSQMQKLFFDATENSLSNQKNENFRELVGLFARTDFARYGKNVAFNDGEKKSIVKNTEKIIEILEKEICDDEIERKNRNENIGDDKKIDDFAQKDFGESDFNEISEKRK